MDAEENVGIAGHNNLPHSGTTFAHNKRTIVLPMGSRDGALQVRARVRV